MREVKLPLNLLDVLPVLCTESTGFLSDPLNNFILFLIVFNSYATYLFFFYIVFTLYSLRSVYSKTNIHYQCLVDVFW